MKHQLKIFGLLITLFSCAHDSKKNKDNQRPVGEIISNVNSEILHAKFTGKEALRVGDRITILQYKDFADDLKQRDSRNLPLKPHEKQKKVLGSATVSSILNDGYYELKLDRPQHIPAEAFIEKL